MVPLDCASFLVFIGSSAQLAASHDARGNPDSYLSVPEEHACLRTVAAAARPSRPRNLEADPFRPGIEYGGDDAPGLLGLVGSDRQSGIARENVEKQLRIGRQLGRREMCCAGERHDRASPRAGTGQLQDYAFGFKPQSEQIGSCLFVVVEREVGYGPEVHGNLLPIAAQCFAGPKPEDRTGPAPVVQLEVHFGEGLRTVFRLHSMLFDIGRDSLSADLPAGVAGAAGPADRLFRAQPTNGAQDVDLAVAQITVAEADRRLHGDQT